MPTNKAGQNKKSRGWGRSYQKRPAADRTAHTIFLKQQQPVFHCHHPLLDTLSVWSVTVTACMQDLLLLLGAAAHSQHQFDVLGDNRPVQSLPQPRGLSRQNLLSGAHDQHAKAARAESQAGQRAMALGSKPNFAHSLNNSAAASLPQPFPNPADILATLPGWTSGSKGRLAQIHSKALNRKGGLTHPHTKALNRSTLQAVLQPSTLNSMTV